MRGAKEGGRASDERKSRVKRTPRPEREEMFSLLSPVGTESRGEVFSLLSPARTEKREEMFSRLPPARTEKRDESEESRSFHAEQKGSRRAAQRVVQTALCREWRGQEEEKVTSLGARNYLAAGRGSERAIASFGGETIRPRVRRSSKE